MIEQSAMEFVFGLIYLFCGVFMIGWAPRFLFFLLALSIFLLSINGIRLLVRALKAHILIDVLLGILSIGFALFLSRHQYIPNEIIPLITAIYSLAYGISCFLEYIIRRNNGVRHRIYYLLNAFLFFGIGIYLFWNEKLDVNLLINVFGIYCLGLSFRSFGDGWAGMRENYRWNRSVRLMPPAILLAFMPDWILNRIQKANDRYEISEHKTSEVPSLKVMVHVGKSGFQKVGHITFAYHNKVYSYGNYDSDTFKLNGTMGDGVYFTIPMDEYLDHMLNVENNSVFEYGIRVTKEQEGLIEREIQKIEECSIPWQTKIEQESGFSHYEDYMDDYPSRLRAYTQVHFFKIIEGKFKTYWALGDNCAKFTDLVLGKLGSSILNLRGVTSPGTYFAWLEHEYIKRKSPIVYRKVHISA